MSDALYLIVSAVAGIALSVFFYGGLWITVRYIMTNRHPVSLALVSFIVRIAGVGSVFILLARMGGIEHVAVALLAFIIARFAIVRKVKVNPSVQKKRRQAHEHYS